ncbi:5'-methylthioadenosine/S-adenosylhomocysteine nucleosidase family protein [Herbidospora mongoliensis]|uniref:5'-methylthioadenosine/S-adenosylhomocysteine nucleosidase family protein n=1 Tax=Herbidospora mongoliensis TaxID=688067 RepID=UPI0009FEB11D|nr:5'-methylthioadenosine/S-adenosylhomocysteine nucleosidase [Herbidospora mongoliensis]
MTRRPIVILTALDLEYMAVRAHLTNLQPYRHSAGTRFETGRLAGHRVVLAQVGKGNHTSAVITERVISEFQPHALVFAGVAGALWPQIDLGDVVVASHVYAYHGGTSEDDGLKARPRAWETSHEVEQLTHFLHRDGGWKRHLPAGQPEPKVRFAPIAAGEIVQNSAVSAHARWVRQTYNDAQAIEMESAGVAQAAHLNRSLPMVVIRGISDRADGTKTTTDGAGWQPKAAANAAAFAVAVTEELAKEAGHTTETKDDAMSDRVTNIAKGGAQVGVQAGTIHGGVTVGQTPTAHQAPEVALTELRRLLGAARRAGTVDEATYTAAGEEIDVATDSLAEGTPEGRNTALLALKKVSGLLMDVADLAARVVAIIAAIKGTL